MKYKEMINTSRVTILPRSNTWTFKNVVFEGQGGYQSKIQLLPLRKNDKRIKQWIDDPHLRFRFQLKFPLAPTIVKCSTQCFMESLWPVKIVKQTLPYKLKNPLLALKILKNALNKPTKGAKPHPWHIPLKALMNKIELGVSIREVTFKNLKTEWKNSKKEKTAYNQITWERIQVFCQSGYQPNQEEEGKKIE